MQRIACALLSHAPYVDVPACACRYWPGSTASIDRSTFDDAIHTIVVRALSRMKTYTERGMSAPSSYSHGPGARQGSCCGPFSVCLTVYVRRAQTRGVWSLFSSWGRACPASRGDRERAGRRWARVTRAAVELARPTAHYTHTSTRGRWPATAQSTRGERGPAAKPVKKRSQGGKRAEACSARRRPAVCGRPRRRRPSVLRRQGTGRRRGVTSGVSCVASPPRAARPGAARAQSHREHRP